MFHKRVIIFLFSFLFLQNQFTTFANAAECEDFGKKVDEKYNPILPYEEKNNLGIYWAHTWDQNNQKITVKRDKYNFPIVKFSLLEKKLSPGTVVKKFNGTDLSEIDDEALLNLTENSNFAEIQFFNEKKINKIEVSAKKYNYLNFYLTDFVLTSINEVDPKEGFFSIDHKSTLIYKRPDLKDEGKFLSDFACRDHHIKIKKLFYPEKWLTLVQFEKDEDKTSEEKYFKYVDGSTMLEILSTGLVKIRSRFDFSDFPFDTQVLEIQYKTDQLPSGEDSDGFAMISISFTDQVLFSLNKYMDHNYLQEWKVLSTNASSNFVKTESGYVDQLTLSIEIERNKNYYIFKIIIPVLLILVVAWCVLWIPTKEIESRLTTSIVAFLSLIAFNFVFQDDIPKLDILTSLDKFILLSYAFCAIPIFTTIRLSKSIEKNQKRASSWNRKIRLVGGAIYIFLTLTIFYPSL